MPIPQSNPVDDIALVAALGDPTGARDAVCGLRSPRTDPATFAAGSRVLPALVDLVASDDVRLRDCLTQVFYAHQAEILPLLTAGHDPDRDWMAGSIADDGEYTDSFVALLGRSLRTGNVATQVEVVDSAAMVGTAPFVAVEVAAAAAPSPIVRARAFVEAGDRLPEDVRYAGLADTSAEVRVAALPFVAISLPEPLQTAVSADHCALIDADRVCAASTGRPSELWSPGQAKAVSTLRALATGDPGDPDATVRLAAAKALSEHRLGVGDELLAPVYAPYEGRPGGIDAAAAAPGEPTIAALLSSTDIARGPRSELQMHVEAGGTERTLRVRVRRSAPTWMSLMTYEPGLPERITLHDRTGVSDYDWTCDAPGASATVPPADLSHSWRGSHFTFSEMLDEDHLTTDYDGSITERPGEGQPDGVYVVTLVPKAGLDVPWARVVAQVRPDRMPVSVEYFDASGTLQRTVTYSDYAIFGNRMAPRTIRAVPAASPEEFTLITYSYIDFDDWVNPRTLRMGCP
jgi:hypothetical protein